MAAEVEKLATQSVRRQTELASQIQTIRNEALRERRAEIEEQGLLGEQLRKGVEIVEEDKKKRDEEAKEKEDADFIERMRKKAAESKADAEYALEKIELEKNKNQFIAQGLVSTSNLIATVAGKEFQSW